MINFCLKFHIFLKNRLDACPFLLFLFNFTQIRQIFVIILYDNCHMLSYFLLAAKISLDNGGGIN